MEDQDPVAKVGVGKAGSNVQQKHGIRLEKSNTGKRTETKRVSNDTMETMYPSSSSYTTAEEGPTSNHNHIQISNGIQSASKAVSMDEKYSVTELCSRISHLEDLLAGKEAALIAVTQELDAIKEMSCIDASIGPLASGFDVDFKASIAEYNRKLQEHAAALCQRDEMIQKLAMSLKQSVRDREELKNEAGRLTEQVHTLQSQLHAVGQQVQQPQSKLLEALQEKDALLLKKSTELTQCKAQSSKEVQFLMSSLEALQQRAARSASAPPPAIPNKDELSIKLSKELKDLSERYETDKTQLTGQLVEARRIESLLRSQLTAAQNECEKLNLDISSLKLAHDTQLSAHEGAYFSQSAHEEQLNQKRDDREKRIIELENEVESLQLLLNEKSLECARQGDKIERLQAQALDYTAEITTYHQTLEQYKKQIDERQMKCSEDLARKDANHRAEIALLNGRISELQEAHSRQLHSMHQDLNRMKQKQMEELATMQLSHENEVNTSKRDAERFRTELREKNSLLVLQEQQLSEEKKWSRSYSQKVEELGEQLNREEHNNEKYRGKVESLEQQLQEIDQACTLYQPQIEMLHQQLKDERQKCTNLMKQLEDVQKQLKVEQERCKAYSASVDTANTNIRDLERKNAEIKSQASKLDQNAKQRIVMEEQKNATLEVEIVKLREFLKGEQNRNTSYQSEFEALNQKIKNYTALDENYKEVLLSLENERAVASRYLCEIDALHQQLEDQNLKFTSDKEKLELQIQANQTSLDQSEKKTEDLKRQLLALQQSHLEEKWDLEKQVNDLLQSAEQCKCLKKHTESLNEIVTHSLDAESQAKEHPKVSYEQLCALEEKLKLLSDANTHLTEERERSEMELNEVKELYATSKENFDKMSNDLKTELARKETDIVKLQAQHNETLLQRKVANEQLNELVSVKAQLERELISVKENYSKEVSTLSCRVLELENKLKATNENVGENTIKCLVKKCHADISFLRSLCASNKREQDTSWVDKATNSMQLLKGDFNCDSVEITGLMALDNLLDHCERYSSEQRMGICPSESPVEQLYKSLLTVEKLKIELNRQKTQIDNLKRECNHLPSSNVDSNLSQAGSQHPSKKVSKIVSCWVEQCRDLEKINEQLKCDVCELQVKLKEAETKMSVSEQIAKKTSISVSGDKCSCEIKYQEERNLLNNSIEALQNELHDKELSYEEKMKSIIEKSKDPNQSSKGLSNLINEFSSKGKEIIRLQNELKKSQRHCQVLLCEKRHLEGQVEKTLFALDESWQTCKSLEADLYKVLKDKSIFQSRLMRLETLNKNVNKKEVSSNEMVWQLIEELSAAAAHDQRPTEVLQDNNQRVTAIEKIESLKKIINKMNSDCESLLVNLQKKNDKAAALSYLQSEALGLRRVQAALLEIEQTILNRCGPAIQLHVDLLKQQLQEKQVNYQDMCETHYSLEAEMREMEECFQQKEERLQGELSKHKATAKYWQMKAQSSDAQLSTLRLIEQSHHESFSEILVEVDSMYTQALSILNEEVERTAAIREAKVRAEMSEKFASAEKKYMQRFDDLSKQIKSESNVKALQLCHEQEIEAVLAKCEYVRYKDIHKLQETSCSFLKHPLLTKIDASASELSYLLMKHNLSLQYKLCLERVSSSLQGELEKEFTYLEEKIGSSSTNDCPDLSSTAPILYDETCLSSLEQLVLKCNEMSEKLLEMQTEGLQSLLSTFKEHHEVIVGKFRSMTNELNSLCDIKNIQEELAKVKEEHQLALESLCASHKAEVCRLRVLSEQNDIDSSETNETALNVLRRELEEKHKKQMEELRTYFEQKCADFEKHYSEEVFSQHSRKLSDCSSASESELVSEMYYAGPGSSSCTGAATTPHFCDMLGECSFKELEENTRAVDLEKLFVDNREQIETMRLALESRHQGELEAQKELYEAKVEELLQNMNESHSLELKLQSKRLNEMQDLEKSLTIKLSAAEKEILLLKEQISSFGKPEVLEQLDVKISEPQKDVHRTLHELEAELQSMSNTLKRKESESSAQIASLKIKLRQNLEVTSKLEKDMSNLRSKYDSEAQSLSAVINDKIKTIEELNLKIHELSSKLLESDSLRKQFESELKSTCTQMQNDFDSILREKNEEYNSKVNRLQSELEKKHLADIQKEALENEHILTEKVNNLVEEKKRLLEAEYSEYLEFVKKCADDTKMKLIQHHEEEKRQLCENHKKEIIELSKSQQTNHISESKIAASQSSLQVTLCNEGLIKESALSNCLQELLKLSSEMPLNQQQHLEKIILKLCREEVIHQQKLHQELESRLESVQKDCERRFHLQLEEARADIVKALEQQIQQLLDDSTDTMDKPVELQQLEKKFAHKYQQKLTDMQNEYEAKVSVLLSKHAAQLSAARNKNQKNNGITSEDLENLYKERDCLRNVAATLRDVVAELVRYFLSWEDDFNNTLMDELAKLESVKDNDILSITNQDDSIILEQSHNVSERDSTASDDEIPVIVATPAKGREPSSFVKRVHFAPDVSGILSLLDDGSLLDGVGLNCSIRDASLNFQEELDRCLARLRSDSAALYALSKPALSSVVPKQQCVPLPSEDEATEKLSEKLSEALHRAEQLQRENEGLQSQIYTLQEEHKMSVDELEAIRERLTNFEQEARHQAELVAEGYGEGERSITCDVPSSPRATTVGELQSKARALLLGESNVEEGSGVVSPNTSQLLPHVVEELCRDWERLAEDSKHKQEDLQQQVEAADKQLRASRTFMDEQAAEREQERDEFVQEITRLQELLRDKDRDRTSHQHMNHESTDLSCMHLKHLGLSTSVSVETLENQLKETQLTLQEAREKLEKLQAEHKQAVEKIWTLRDIISDLEVQVASKAEEAASVSAQNAALQQMVEQQGRTQLELAQEMEEIQLCSNNGKLAEQISQLEEQLKKHQMLADQLGDPNVIEHMKNQLRDLGMSLELHTRELECANASNALPASPCLSSPSEDVSIRETLWAMRCANENKDGSHSADPCLALPLYEVSVVMEQWQKHARADDAILKKIREIDVHVDDMHAEKDALVSRLQEQMQLSSSLQSKLDEYRCKSDVKLSQATTEMQSQIEDLRVEIHNYDETLESREKQIENLRMSLLRAENELRTRDAEIRKSAEAERNIAAQLQLQVSKLSADKNKLEAMLSEKNAMHVSLPALVESMLVDKNDDIDRLERQVQHLSKQMELSSHYVATPSTTLEFEYSESEKVRAHVELSPVLHLRRSVNLSPINESVCRQSDVHPDEISVPFGAQQMSLENNNPEIEVSLKPIPIEEEMIHSQQNPSNESISEILSSSADTFNTSSLSSCEKRVATLEEELEEKNKLIANYEQQIQENAAILSEMEQKCKGLEDCEKKLLDMVNLEKELSTVKTELAKTRLELSDKIQQSDVQSTQKPTELEAKESEIQRLKDEVGATQTILANLQRKVQEAKQIARSPNRSSPEKNQALQAVQNELETAKQEIVELKDLCTSIRSEVEGEFLQKQAQFEIVLNREQQAKKSLLETLDKMQKEKNELEQETNKTILIKLEKELKETKDKLTEIYEDNAKLQTELSQVNMECVTLKQQLSTPIREATSLAHKLESEKKFSDTLKEELLLFKTKASSLDEECQSLKEQTKVLQEMLDSGKKNSQITSENEILLKDISHLKTEIESLLQELKGYKDIIDELSHRNAVLTEENTDVGKELSDMKQIIIDLRGEKTSRDETQRELQSKLHELNELKIQKDKYMKELFSLRQGLNNIHSDTNDLSGLTSEDHAILHNLQKLLFTRKHRGEGDGPWNRLSFTETDIHEIQPANSPESELLDDLTDLVQHEVDVSVQLDQSLLQTINPHKKEEVSVAEKMEKQADQAVFGRSQDAREIQSQKVRETEAQDKISQLEKELYHMQSSVNLLHAKLEAERAQYCTLQQQDCVLIEQMRVKLSEALDGQARLQMQLQSEKSKQHCLFKDTNVSNQSSKPLSDKNSDELQEQLNAAKSELARLQLEKDASERQIKRLLEAEIQWSRRRALTEEKHRRRIDQLQSLHAETQQECLMLRQELSALNQKLQVAQEESAKDLDAQLKNHTPFVERLKNMNAFLEEHIEENVRMANEMEKLIDEHRKLRSRIAQLEGQLADKRSNESFEAANARFAAERAGWEAEQKALLHALNEAKQKQLLLPDSDVEERVSHLFGRYLRMQSYRKALVWQKRYLLSVISGLNESKTLAASHLTSFGGKAKEKTSTSRQKFRSAVLVIIALQRMRFMVERWLRGKRIGCGVVVQQTLSQYTFTSGKQPTFAGTRVPTDEMRSGLSQSPPTLERPRQSRSQPSEHPQLPRFSMTNRGYGSSTLSECVTNFHLVQQRFDALLSNPPK
ncbi:pericentrin isoform X2 [Thrips palmi]|uniref:Pericentrin isoform X2 n=1 Tax=Thrips palmi TaxID=161013 RepID=A0A6P9AHJ1_THRPL|nr:pericentrin isoform X2 [Thrips palmi]